MIAIRSALFNVLFYLVLFGMLVVGMPLMLLGEQAIKNYARRWGRISIWLLEKVCGVRLEYRGLDNLPEGGFIVAAKHQSFLDVLALLPLAPRFAYIMKRELAWIPLFGQFMMAGGMIAINRTRGRTNMPDLIRQVRSILDGGGQLIIFPEGTRRPPGAEPQYKSGVTHLYVGSGMPCVPVALNSGLFWPRRSFLRHPGTLVIEVMPAIPPGVDKARFLPELQSRLEAPTNRLLAAAREERSRRA